MIGAAALAILHGFIEQALFAGNRELIARFEKKIQATLARVWGADKNITL